MGTMTPPPPAPLNKGGRVGVSTKNDDSTKPDPNPAALSPETREQVQSVLDKSPSVEDVNMNSGYRSGDPTAHGEGQAADINEVNKIPVRLAVDPSAPAGKRKAIQEHLRAIEASARDNREVELFMSPIGGFHRDTKTGEIIREATQEEVDAHWDHIHMTIMK